MSPPDGNNFRLCCPVVTGGARCRNKLVAFAGIPCQNAGEPIILGGNMQGIPPVRCPKCGQRQNRFSFELDPSSEAFGPVDCMVCGRPFDREEYLMLLADARALKPAPILSES